MSNWPLRLHTVQKSSWMSPCEEELDQSVSLPNLARPTASGEVRRGRGGTVIWFSLLALLTAQMDVCGVTLQLVCEFVLQEAVHFVRLSQSKTRWWRWSWHGDNKLMEMCVLRGGLGVWTTDSYRAKRTVCDRVSVSPVFTYIPRAGAGQGEGTDGAGGGGRGEAAQLRDAAVFGWATWVKWDRRQRRNKQKRKKKKDGEGGENKNRPSVWHTLERESSLASMSQGSGEGGRGGRGGVRSQTAVLVQESGSERWAWITPAGWTGVRS